MPSANVPRRSSRSKSGRRSRSSSPLRGRSGRLPAPNLLANSVSVLASIVSEDCRFQVTAPRPSRPPNALQSVVLDAAGYLLHMNRRNPKVVSQIGFALLPAFYTFRPEMHIRLLAFFGTMVMRPMLESLREAQGTVMVEGWLSQTCNLRTRIDDCLQPLPKTLIRMSRSSKSTLKRLETLPQVPTIRAGSLGLHYRQNPQILHRATPPLRISWSITCPLSSRHFSRPSLKISPS